MKQHLILAVLTVAAFFTGCNKVKDLANINVDLPYSTEVTVPEITGYPTGTPLPMGGIDLPSVTVSFATNSKEYMAQYGTAADKVVSVYLKSLALQIQSPPGANFDFLDNVKVFLSAKSQPEVLVASQTSVPKGASTLYLTTNTDANLKNYFVQDTVYLRLAAHINAVPPGGEVLTISSVFHMVANPLN